MTAKIGEGLSDESIEMIMSRRVCLACNHWYRPLETDTWRLCFVCRRGVVRASPDAASWTTNLEPRLKLRSATEMLRDALEKERGGTK